MRGGCRCHWEAAHFKMKAFAVLLSFDKGGERRKAYGYRNQSAFLDRKKFFADPIMVTTIVVLIAFLTLFILCPLVGLSGPQFLTDQRIRFFMYSGGSRKMSNTSRGNQQLAESRFPCRYRVRAHRTSFAYVEVYVKLKTRFMEGISSRRSSPCCRSSPTPFIL